MVLYIQVENGERQIQTIGNKIQSMEINYSNIIFYIKKNDFAQSNTNFWFIKLFLLLHIFTLRKAIYCQYVQENWKIFSLYFYELKNVYIRRDTSIQEMFIFSVFFMLLIEYPYNLNVLLLYKWSIFLSITFIYELYSLAIPINAVYQQLFSSYTNEAILNLNEKATYFFFVNP